MIDSHIQTYRSHALSWGEFTNGVFYLVEDTRFSYTAYTNRNLSFLKFWARLLKRQGAWLRAGRPGFDPG